MAPPRARQVHDTSIGTALAAGPGVQDQSHGTVMNAANETNVTRPGVAFGFVRVTWLNSTAMAELDERYFNVNKDGSLRAPAAFWLALAFLARHVIVAAVVLAMAKRSPDVVRVLGDSYPWFMLPLELPVIALMFACANRVANAGRALRWIWAHGRQIILLMTLVHLGVAGWVLGASDVWRTWPELFVASCALVDIAIALAVTKDDYFRQLFADFPEPRKAAS